MVLDPEDDEEESDESNEDAVDDRLQDSDFPEFEIQVGLLNETI